MNQPKLEFISGLMKGGKSAEIIDRIESTEQSFLIIKPAIDTRDGAYVQTRKHNRKYPAVPVDESNVQLVDLVLYGVQKYYTIFVDEVHFFSEEFVRRLADYCYTYGADLVVSGLLRDFKGEMFPSSKWLFHNNDEMIFLQGECDCCGSQADKDILFDKASKTVIQSGDSTLVEDNHVMKDLMYLTVCESCYQDMFIRPMKGMIG